MYFLCPLAILALKCLVDKDEGGLWIKKAPYLWPVGVGSRGPDFYRLVWIHKKTMYIWAGDNFTLNSISENMY